MGHIYGSCNTQNYGLAHLTFTMVLVPGRGRTGTAAGADLCLNWGMSASVPVPSDDAHSLTAFRGPPASATILHGT